MGRATTLKKINYPPDLWGKMRRSQGTTSGKRVTFSKQSHWIEQRGKGSSPETQTGFGQKIPSSIVRSILITIVHVLYLLV
jgi:hypothetical protein